MLAAALHDRPDYQAGKSRLEAQAPRVDIDWAGHWPTISVLGAYGLRADFRGDRDHVGRVEPQIRQEVETALLDERSNSERVTAG